MKRTTLAPPAWAGVVPFVVRRFAQEEEAQKDQKKHGAGEFHTFKPVSVEDGSIITKPCKSFQPPDGTRVIG